MGRQDADLEDKSAGSQVIWMICTAPIEECSQQAVGLKTCKRQWEGRREIIGNALVIQKFYNEALE